MVNYTYILRFLIGLAITLAYLYAAFEYKSEQIIDVNFEDIDTTTIVCFPISIDLIDPTPTPDNQIPLTYQEQETPLYKEFTHEELGEALQDIMVDDCAPTRKKTNASTKKETKEKKSSAQTEFFYTRDEVSAQPVGGMKSFYAYLRKELKYPKEAAEAGAEGKVFLTFIVETDGTFRCVQIVRSIHPLLDEEALRVMRRAPKWIPATSRGTPVPQKMTWPIHFNLKNIKQENIVTDEETDNH